jgi:hypothetical protein
MGPDEFVTRQELELVLRLLYARFRHQADAIGRLAGMLAAAPHITRAECEEFLARLQGSPTAEEVKQAAADLKEYEAIRCSEASRCSSG